jgi:hypothetical protein
MSKSGNNSKRGTGRAVAQPFRDYRQGEQFAAGAGKYVNATGPARAVNAHGQGVPAARRGAGEAPSPRVNPGQ